MDSTWLGALVSIYNHANKADIIVILENVPNRIYKIMRDHRPDDRVHHQVPRTQAGPDPKPTSSGRVQ